MAVDYTKVFTVMGSYIDKINDYYAYIGTFTEDKADIDSLLGGQDLVRLGDGLTEDYGDFQSDVSSWINTLISHVTTLLTDEDLIGSNFPFGTGASLDLVWPALIHDMVENDWNADSSTSTVGSIDYDMANNEVGVLVVGTLLDGVTPPVDGGQPIREYAGLSTQMTPENETLVFTCTSDSENGAILGSETFSITGTLASSDPFSPGGENVGQLGTIIVSDNNSNQYISNGGFDNWGTDGSLTSWTEFGGVHGTDYQKGLEVLNPGSQFSLQTIPSGNTLSLSQNLSSTSFIRGKSYFLSLWSAKDTDEAGDQLLEVKLTINGSNALTLSVQPTATVWVNYSGQFLIPDELASDPSSFRISIYTVGETVLDVSNDPMYLDNLVIVPCEYHSGVATAIFSGPDKFLIGDKISLPLSNDGLGLFQSFVRKAFRIQIPTDDTPSISEDLIV